MNAIEKGLVLTLVAVGLIFLVSTEWSQVEMYQTDIGERRAYVNYSLVFSSLDSALESWEEENLGLHPVECRRFFRSELWAEWSCSIHDSRPGYGSKPGDGG